MCVLPLLSHEVLGVAGTPNFVNIRQALHHLSCILSHKSLQKNNYGKINDPSNLPRKKGKEDVRIKKKNVWGALFQLFLMRLEVWN